MKQVNINELLKKNDEIKGNESNSKGKVLQVKVGYNPNSSSIGSVIFALPAALLGLTVAFGAISGYIMQSLMKKVDDKDQSEDQSGKHSNTKQDK